MDYGYGQGFVEPSVSLFKAGINEVKLSFVGLAEYKTKEGESGQALDFVFVHFDNPSSEFRHRMFPIVQETLPSRYQDYLKNMQKSSKQPLSFDDFCIRQYDLFSGEVKSIVTQFFSVEKFDNAVKAWGKKLKDEGIKPTFELFIGLINKMLVKYSPDFKDIKGYLLLAYQPKGQFLSVPKYNRDCGVYLSTDPDRLPVLWENSKMLMVKPAVERSGFEIEGSGPIIANVPAGAIAGPIIGSPVVQTEITTAPEDDDDLPF